MKKINVVKCFAIRNMLQFYVKTALLSEGKIRKHISTYSALNTMIVTFHMLYDLILTTSLESDVTINNR